MIICDRRGSEIADEQKMSKASVATAIGVHKKKMEKGDA